MRREVSNPKMPVRNRIFVSPSSAGVNRRPEHWLRLFGAVCVTVHLLVFVIIVAITPIIPLPAFIDFASAAYAAKSPEFEHDVTVTLRRNGDVFLQSRRISLASLAQDLRASRLRARYEPTLRLRIDRSTPFRFVRRVALAARDAGYPRFTVMVRYVPSDTPGMNAKPIHPVTSSPTAPATPENAAAARPLRLVRNVNCQPDNILAQKLNWLRQDLQVRFRVTADSAGYVTKTETMSITPPHMPVATEFARHQAKCLATGKFEPPVSSPYTFAISVRLTAPRNQFGKIKSATERSE